MGAVIKLTESDFEQEVLRSEPPVLVDYWAPWCGPCRAVAPVLERIAAERSGSLKVAKVNVDEEPHLADFAGVNGIPFLVLYRGAKPAAHMVRAHPKHTIEKALALPEAASRTMARVADRIVYVSRLARLPLVNSDGTDVGRVLDVVIDLGGRPPRVNGFVVAVQRRRVFVGAGRVGEVETDGLRLRRGSINLRQFELRPGEKLLAGELIGRRLRQRRVVDIGLAPAPEPFAWEVATVALGSRRVPGVRRLPEVIDWSEAAELFAYEHSVDRQVAELGGLHPAEMAAAIRRLPLSRRRTLAAALEDERLADLLEELSEDEQVRLVEGLDRSRLGRVLDEMEADDAADLLGELSAGRRAELLGAMDPKEAEPVRRLLSYAPDTAGGLMTPEPVILASQATVAEALARLRDPDLPLPLAAQVFVCRPPLETPTGRYLGSVGMQRLLREPPSKPIGRCLDEEAEAIGAAVSVRDVAARLAAYDVVALAVTDEADRLIGAVTIDDVLDHLLPVNWRMTLTPS